MHRHIRIRYLKEDHTTLCSASENIGIIAKMGRPLMHWLVESDIEKAKAFSGDEAEAQRLLEEIENSCESRHWDWERMQ